MKSTVKNAAVALAILFGSAASAIPADDRRWNDKYDTLLDKSDVSVKIDIDDRGRPRRTFEMPEGVRIVQIRRGGSIGTRAEDTKHRSAPMCGMMLAVQARALLSICQPTGYDGYLAAYDYAIKQILEFIVANSRGIHSKADWEKFIYERTISAKYMTAYGSKDAWNLEPGHCSENTFRFVLAFTSKPPAAIRENVDKSLAVPRFPALSPCL